MVEVLLRDIHVVLETLLVSLGLVLHFLLVLLVLVLEVIREGLLVLQREVVLERLELLLHRVDDRGPRRLGERDLMRALVIGERGAPRDLRVHLRNVLRVPGLPRASGGDGLVLEVLLVLPLPLLNLDGELQRLRIGLARAADLELDPGVEPFEGLARSELPAGDQLADLVVRHAALPEVVNLDLAGANVLAEGVRLHLLVAGVHPLLHVGVLFVNNRARADDAARQQEGRVDCHREVERALRERPRLGRRRDRGDDADQHQRALAELLDGVGVVLEED